MLFFIYLIEGWAPLGRDPSAESGGYTDGPRIEKDCNG